MKKILDNIAGLFKLKSILSLVVIITTCYLTCIGKMPSEAFSGLTSAIITYYFTRRTLDNE